MDKISRGMLWWVERNHFTTRRHPDIQVNEWAFNTTLFEFERFCPFPEGDLKSYLW